MAMHRLTVLTLEPGLPSAHLTCHIYASLDVGVTQKSVAGLLAVIVSGAGRFRGQSIRGGGGRAVIHPASPLLSQLLPPTSHTPLGNLNPKAGGSLDVARCIVSSAAPLVSFHSPGSTPSMDGCCFSQPHQTRTWATGRGWKVPANMVDSVSSVFMERRQAVPLPTG